MIINTCYSTGNEGKSSCVRMHIVTNIEKPLTGNHTMYHKVHHNLTTSIINRV